MLRFLLAAMLACCGTTAASAATISIVSMHYSVSHPVPHIRYTGDTEFGDVDKLRNIFETFVKCRTECLSADGGATAILSMQGPGGSYDEGLALAAYLRDNAIATVIQRGDVCASACAFAFLGGSGYSSQSGMGAYVDRTVEPGGNAAFHSPYFEEDAILAALEARGTSYVMDENRNVLSRMVKELVQWNVDPEIIHEMVSKGPSETYDVTRGEDYFLTRSSLPTAPVTEWTTDLPSAIRNACMRLLAIDERANPLEFVNFFDLPWQDNLGLDAAGNVVSGYRWSDELLQLGSCGMANAAFGPDMSIQLYFPPGLDGRLGSSPIAFWNRQDGWSTAGGGHNPRKRILHKGPMNDFFLPLGIPVDDLDLPGEWSMYLNRFYAELPPLMPTMDPGLSFFAAGPGTRISNIGDVWVFEQTATKRLFDAALVDPGLGRIYVNNASSSVTFVRDGVHADGSTFSSFGFANGDSAAVVTVLIARPGNPVATADEMNVIRRIQCAADFQGLRLAC